MFILAIFTIFLLSLSSVRAFNVPQKFYGTVVYEDGNFAPDSTIITAKLNGAVADEATVSAGKYSYGDDKLVVPDDSNTGGTVTFYIGNLKSNEEYIFESGAVTELNLTFPGNCPGECTSSASVPAGDSSGGSSGGDSSSSSSSGGGGGGGSSGGSGGGGGSSSSGSSLTKTNSADSETVDTGSSNNQELVGTTKLASENSADTTGLDTDESGNFLTGAGVVETGAESQVQTILIIIGVLILVGAVGYYARVRKIKAKTVPETAAEPPK